ncbi:hypothetical protein HDE_01838 [Halotydeus destructor]|nr:hypothetical protein HDE_01838 [Halotydeus destructor]
MFHSNNYQPMKLFITPLSDPVPTCGMVTWASEAMSAIYDLLVLTAIFTFVQSQSYSANVGIFLAKDAAGQDWNTTGQLTADFHGQSGAVDTEPLSATTETLASGQAKGYPVTVPFQVSTIDAITIKLTSSQSQAVFLTKAIIQDPSPKIFCPDSQGTPLEPGGQLDLSPGQC